MPLPRSFFIVWPYIANYGVMRNFPAETPMEAAERVVKGFSADFAKRGTVYVFEGEPAFTYSGDK